MTKSKKTEFLIMSGIALLALLSAIVISLFIGADTSGEERQTEPPTTETTAPETEAETEPPVYENIPDLIGTEYAYEKGITNEFISWCNSEKFIKNGESRDLTKAMTDAVFSGGYNESLWYTLTGETLNALLAQYSVYEGKGGAIILEDEEDDNAILIGFTGEITLADNASTVKHYKTQANGVYSVIGGELISELQKTDILVTTLDSPIYEGEEIPECGASAENIEVLTELGVDIVNLANDGIGALGEKGIEDTIEALSLANIYAVGAGAGEQNAGAVNYFVSCGIKLAVIACDCSGSDGVLPAKGEDGIGVFSAYDDHSVLDEKVAQAKKNSDYVIVCLNFGKEGESEVSIYQRDLAESLSQAGADLIIGTNTKKLQMAENIGDTYVVYGLGKFWYDMTTEMTAVPCISLTCDVDGTVKSKVNYTLCYQRWGTVNTVSGEEAQAVKEAIKNDRIIKEPSE